MTRELRAKILVTEAMPLIEKEKKILERFAYLKVAKCLTEDCLLVETDDADVIMVLYAKITKRIIDSAKKLKGIVRYGIGVDNIDIDAATERKVLVANVPDYCIGAVADHAFALLLASCRKILIADKIVRSGDYLNYWVSPSEKIKGLDLEGKTLGIIGFGKIGRAVMKRAKGFGMKVIAFDPFLDKGLASALDVEHVQLDTLLRKSDFVSIHAPLTSETCGMIGERELRQMKKTAYLINVARGPIIDEKALLKALDEKWIAGAGIDVYEMEPPAPENKLFKAENIVVTPHIAWYTEEALWRLEMSAANEAVKILQGRLPENLVNIKVLSCVKK